MITVERLDAPHTSDALFALERRLLAHDPCWVPPLERLERRRLRPSNALFQHADLAVFLARRGTDVVGSLSALVDHGYNQHKGAAICWFGYVAFEDDAEVVGRLFDAVREQARAWQCTELRGPRNLSRVDQVGLTVEGFDRLPPMMQNTHPAYYVTRLAEAGLQPHHDRLAYEIGLYQPDGSPRPLPDKLQAKADAVDVEGLVVRRARWRSMQSDLSDAHTVLNAAYQTVPDVSPMPRATFLAMGRAFLTVADRRLVQLAYVGRRPIAFTVCLPEINEALVHTGGRLRGLADAYRHRHEIRTAAFKLIGVLPEYRASGVHARMVEAVVEGARAAGYTRIDGSIIDERNAPMRAVVEGAGMQVYRRYRLFQQDL
jgi:GNAT superfamily N-acetyltransferase